MIAGDDLLAEIGWENRERILSGLLAVHLESIPETLSNAGVVQGNRYHQELADIAAHWLRTQGLAWKTEGWHAGYRCDLLAERIMVEVGNTDPDRAIEHLYYTDGRFCVLPYQEGEPLTMLVFQRGPKWNQEAVSKSLIKKDKHSKAILDRLL